MQSDNVIFNKMILLVKLGLLLLITNIENNNVGLQGKIVGGTFVDISQYPHAVFLYISVSSKEDTFCGSSVVNQRTLVTAAHCVNYEEELSIDARAGSSDISEAEVVREVIYSIVHEKYNKRTLYADIALLMLDKDLPFGKTIKRVIIKPSFHAGIEGSVAGWGCSSEVNCKNIPHLKHLRQKVLCQAQCQKFGTVVLGTICANTGAETMSYPFKGDSGSGLITKDYQLIGLVSHRYDNQRDLITYINVSYFIQWMHKTSLSLFKYCRKSKSKRKKLLRLRIASSNYRTFN